MQVPYTAPSFKIEAFHCPYCGAFAKQSWASLFHTFASGNPFQTPSGGLSLSLCTHCKAVAIWNRHVMVMPEASTGPPAHPDLPELLIVDYEEARAVLSRSPRSSAALLRLVLQKLCKELGEKGDNINADIASMVKKGLPAEVQQALDIVRVIGNEQVHPGDIDIRDNPELAVELFKLINFIVEDRITRPRTIREIYGALPPDKLRGIQNRDA